ncbi:D-sedoheptulose-7-phosphate isomerase [Streptomyces koyangensis]|uniref:D-sedoheptulose-7-phosphate isomerase n=1 Tax=Streptomyces koyangensis TaxID=188770 RepID=UPI003C2C5FAA
MQPASGAAPVVDAYLNDLADAAARLDRAPLTDLVDIVHAALTRGRRVLIAGNGGSATAATHMASDWAKAGSRYRPAPLVLALNDNLARITAIANDSSYEAIFADQLPGAGGPGDVLVLLSVSGGSPNLVAAARTAKAQGMTVVSALGHPGDVAAVSDVVALLGDGDYGLAEDLHLSLTHLVVRLLNGGAPQRYRALAGAVAGGCHG